MPVRPFKVTILSFLKILFFFSKVRQNLYLCPQDINTSDKYILRDCNLHKTV